jgi:hypothetical protein
MIDKKKKTGSSPISRPIVNYLVTVNDMGKTSQRSVKATRIITREVGAFVLVEFYQSGRLVLQIPWEICLQIEDTTAVNKVDNKLAPKSDKLKAVQGHKL